MTAGASAGLPRDKGSRLAAMIRAMTTNAAQNRTFAATGPVIPPTPRAFAANGTRGLKRRGNSSIKRVAIAPTSACVHLPQGNRAINEANLCVAFSFGSSDNSAASSQGSTSNRASAERTLSGISFRSVPIGAWRKSSNSGLKKDTEAAEFTMTTNCIASNNRSDAVASIAVDAWRHATLGSEST